MSGVGDFRLKVRKGNAIWARGKRKGQAAFIEKFPVPFSWAPIDSLPMTFTLQRYTAFRPY